MLPLALKWEVQHTVCFVTEMFHLTLNSALGRHGNANWWKAVPGKCPCQCVTSSIGLRAQRREMTQNSWESDFPQYSLSLRLFLNRSWEWKLINWFCGEIVFLLNSNWVRSFFQCSKVVFFFYFFLIAHTYR